MQHFVPSPSLIHCAVLIVASMLVNGFAAERSLTLDDCVTLAIKHNLNLESRSKDPLIAAQELRAANAAYQPLFSADSNYHSTTTAPGTDLMGNPFLGNETTRQRVGSGLNGYLPTGATYNLGANRTDASLLNQRGQFSGVSGFAGLEVRQPLLKNLTIDSTRLQIGLSRLNLRVSEAELRRFLMGLVASVEITYYDLVASRERLQIAQQSYDLASQLVTQHGKRMEVGRMAPLDVRQAQSRVATSDASLSSARNQVADRENELKLLLTDDFAGWAETTINPITPMNRTVSENSRETSWKSALTKRPEILQAKLELDMQNILLRFTSNQRYPSLDLIASYGLAGTDRNIRDRGAPDWAVGVVLSIPLGNGKARANHEAQKFEVQQALIAYKQLEQSIMAEVSNALNAVKFSAERVAANGKARSFAESALSAEQTKLANGKSTNFIVLQLQQELIQARLSETQAVNDHNRALSILRLREGDTLERHSISLTNPEASAETGAGRTP